jgi:hypothetical protein
MKEMLKAAGMLLLVFAAVLLVFSLPSINGEQDYIKENSHRSMTGVLFEEVESHGAQGWLWALGALVVSIGGLLVWGAILKAHTKVSDECALQDAEDEATAKNIATFGRDVSVNESGGLQ